MKNNSKNTTPKPDFSGIIKAYPCGFIPRMEIGKATGGLLSPEYMCNLDSNRDVEGIRGRFKVGRKVCYPVQSVVEFLEKRTQVIDC